METAVDRVPPTFAEAERISPYTLAQLWAGSTRRPAQPSPVRPRVGNALPVRAPESELEELATMAALRAWLERWTGAQVHRALLSGASVEQVAAAAGNSAADIVLIWREYDKGQRAYLWPDSPRLARPDEHDQVAAVLTAWERQQ